MLYSLDLKDIRTYGWAALFVIGNVVLPQLCHLLPGGGPMWLPIYFFTLVGAYKYGWRVGLITALASPLVNSFFFGMPAVAMLPVILIKSSILALAAGFIAHRTGKVTLLAILGTILTYQLIGGVAEWALTGSLNAALQDFRIGLPGMLVQLFGGWAVIKYLLTNR